jgi:hypothetical protein
MRNLIIGSLTTALLLGTVPAQSMPPEGCEAVNPGAPTCTLTITHDTAGPVSGVAGEGDWVVIVKKGKKKTKLTSPSSGDATAQEFLFVKGMKVTAKALSPGSALAVGGE